MPKVKVFSIAELHEYRQWRNVREEMNRLMGRHEEAHHGFPCTMLNIEQYYERAHELDMLQLEPATDTVISRMRWLRRLLHY